MALRAMCRYYTLLTPSPSRENQTIQQPYWYRSLVTESSMFPMWTSPSEYGAGAGCVLVGPPSGLWGGATVGLAVVDSWSVSAIPNDSESSLVDSTNRHFQWLRWSLVLFISCRCFPSWEVLLWAVFTRACAVYSSSLAAWVRVTPTCLPSQMARSISGVSAEGCDLDLCSVQKELHSLLLRGAGSLLVSTSEAHWPASLNSCMMCCLTITPLVGVVGLNHIQMSTVRRLCAAVADTRPNERCTRAIFLILCKLDTSLYSASCGC